MPRNPDNPRIAGLKETKTEIGSIKVFVTKDSFMLALAGTTQSLDRFQTATLRNLLSKWTDAKRQQEARDERANRT